MKIFHSFFLLSGATLLVTGLATGTVATADEKPHVVFGTNWLATATTGGFYQAAATGLYQKHGLDVEIKQGGPQINGLQLLLTGKIDFYLGDPIQTIQSVHQGAPLVTVAAAFQKTPQVIICHQDVSSLADAKGHPMLIDQSSAAQTFWPWLKMKYGYTESMRRPYTFSVAPILNDDRMCQQGYLGGEPFDIEKAGLNPSVFLLADQGYPPYAQTIVTRDEVAKEHPERVRAFVAATMEGWKSYLENPEPGNALIRQYNPEQPDERLSYGVSEMRKYDMLGSGDAVQHGIGTMSDARWKAINDFMIETGQIDDDDTYKQAYSLEFVEHRP